jgi:hypothetical protein
MTHRSGVLSTFDGAEGSGLHAHAGKCSHVHTQSVSRSWYW